MNAKKTPNLTVDTSYELKEMLEVAGTASLLACQNMEVIGDPGSGKTSLLHFMSMQVFGGQVGEAEDGHYLKLECTPSTRAERIIGHENPLYVLDPMAEEKGIPRWVLDETPRDPQVWHVLLNERSRLNEIAADALLPVMDIELNKFHQVTFWADSNWLSNNPRTAALGDRFAMRVWYVNPIVDVAGVMSKPPVKTWQFQLPDFQTIAEVRAALDDWRKTGQNSKPYKAILATIQSIAEAIPGTSFQLNNRRITQWVNILFAMGYYHTGKLDFDALPIDAMRALAFCYPTATPVEALEWRKIVMASVDPLETAIAEFEAQAMKQWMESYDNIRKTRNPQERQQQITNQIGTLLAGYQKELQTRYQGDVRAKQAIARLSKVYQKMLRNEPIE